MATETMATLTGSERQVAWAGEIKARMLAELGEYRAELIRREFGETILRRLDLLREHVAAQTDAKWFIDRRTFAPRDLMERVGRKLPNW
jgi:hypothetical protein